ncbi:MAG: asparagine synthase (glutamine-hydrolyzing), partial [candidate division NC10 bacterium]|nr:asparagine synthase (glutamine-hydrolyzing) [candidate division NC10 bacterium]
MCGIVGVYNYGNPGLPLQAGTIAGMRDTMEHRGPDDAGVFVSPDGKLGLGHRRLSILDLSSLGHQPMATADGRYWIVYNGEVYNFRELRAELEPKGYIFRSASDTEVLLALFTEYGPKMLHRLRGMFAMAIWDAREERLWLARDRIGIKPLYYTCRDGRFLFASEIKAILGFPGIPRSVHLPGLHHFLSFLTTPAPLTLFEGIQKLPAGHTLTVQRDGSVTLEEWWDVFDGVQPRLGGNEAAMAERVLHLLRESIRYRMVSDVPFGVFLSGGIDSSTNVALMAELMDRPVETFSIGFTGEERYNEFPYARQIAERFRTNHHEVQIGVNDLIDFLPQLIHHQDEPIADPVCVPVYFVARLAKEHGVTVCQVGEGSDELFCGYPLWGWFLRSARWNRGFAPLPRPVRRWAPALLRTAGKHHGLPYECLRRAAEGDTLFWSGAEAFYESQKAELLTPWVRERLGGLSSYEVVAAHRQRFLERSPLPDFLTWMGYIDLKLRLPELLLMRVDKMTMATAVEARVPFLDHE